MKFSLFKNDKSTARDELVLLGMIAVLLAVGIPLFVLRPAFWIIKQSLSMGMGVLLTVTGLAFIPGLIYRLLTNDKKN